VCVELQRHSQAHKGANQKATECVSDSILLYKSDLAQEPGPALIFEPFPAPCFGPSERPKSHLSERTAQDTITDW
jgi:hypothetical protein